LVQMVKRYQRDGHWPQPYGGRSTTGRSLFFCMRKTELRNTPVVAKLRNRFKVIHPFHPLYQKEFELVDYSKSFGCAYIEYYNELGEVDCIPLAWTDAKGVDPFLEISGGRSFFRLEDLLRLMDLISDLSSKSKNPNLRK
jgi:hypothetical protein